jgi:alkane 1-monooxygenase
MSAAKYWSPFLFLAIVPAGVMLGSPTLGGWAAFLLLPVMPLALTSLDWLGGAETRAEGAPPSPAYRLLPYLYIPLQLGLIAWAGWVVAQPGTTLLEAVGLTLSCGLTAGVFGFLAAHEMVHSPHPGERAYGLVMLAGVIYMQFSIAHLVGHHRRAATYEDPATARRGESAYAFLVRSVGGQARESWAHETERLARAGRPVIGVGNRLILFGLIEAALTIAIGVWSWRALAFFLAQAALAIVMLELFNYIAHYGLVRRPDAAGRLERLGPQHSWNSARRMNNWSLFNMGRHADHHRFSARPYHALEVLPGGAELPSGYAAAILLSLIPPLWRRVMDPRVDAVMDRA